MASKRFKIPTLEEMENADTDKEAPEPLFKRRKEFETPEHDSSKSVVSRIDGIVPSIRANPQSGKPTPQNTTAWSSNSTSSGIISQMKDCTKEAVYNKGGSNGTLGNVVSCDVIESESSNGVDEAQKMPPAGSKPGSSNSLIVNTRQRGNPILKSVRNIPWEYGNIVPDYVMGQANCALFLSLRYHQLHPNYIHERLKLLGRSYDLRVMLVQVDVKEPHHLLKDLAKICLLADCTLILAFSPEEAGRYLETYKIFENKPPEAIMERTEENFMAKFTDCLTRVKSVNKTDCATLISHFGSLANIMEASEEDLSLCPGFGPQKARRLHSIFHEPFLRSAGIGLKPFRMIDFKVPGASLKFPSPPPSHLQQTFGMW